jgi:uncharacterized protein (DUF433 family)
MPVIKGTRVPVYDLAASVQERIPRDRILAAYPTINKHHLDAAVAFAEANPLQRRTRWLSPWLSATLVKSGQIPYYAKSYNIKISEERPYRFRALAFSFGSVIRARLRSCSSTGKL